MTDQRRGDKRRGKRTDTAAQLDEMAAALSVEPPGPASIRERVLEFVVGHWKLVLGITGVLAAFGIGFGVCKLQGHIMRTTPGRPLDEVFIASPAGDTLIVIDHVAIGGGKGATSSSPTAEGTRLTAIDARTGATLAIEVTDHQTCWAGATRLWCRDKYDALHLLEPRTLATVAEAKDLIAAAKLAPPTRRSELDGDGVIVVLEDGRGARISPTTLAVTRLESVTSAWRPPHDAGRCATTSRVSLGAVTLVLASGGTRATLTTDPPPPAESAVPRSPAPTFLEGAFVALPAIPLVLHSGDRSSGPQVISRVDEQLTLRWNAGLAGACRLVAISGSTLVVATGNPEQRALGFDLEHGGARWILAR